MTEWRPISTAPKDGQTILAFFPTRVGTVTRQDVLAVYWVDWGGNCWCCAATGHNLPGYEPTHWMPLPEPPAIDAQHDVDRPYTTEIDDLLDKLRGKRSRTPLPSQEDLKRFLNYDPDTGALTWAVNTSVRFAGDPAFTTKSSGYLSGKFQGTKYLAHRIIWKLVYNQEPRMIDHINRDRSDNRLVNLRAASAAMNSQNRGDYLRKRQDPNDGQGCPTSDTG